MILSPSESPRTDGKRTPGGHPPYTVSFDDGTGIRHSVHVTVETFFESAALALHIFDTEGTPPGPAAHLEIAAQTPIVNHSVTVRRVREWLASGGKTPKEQALKSRGPADGDQGRCGYAVFKSALERAPPFCESSSSRPHSRSTTSQANWSIAKSGQVEDVCWRRIATSTGAGSLPLVHAVKTRRAVSTRVRGFIGEFNILMVADCEVPPNPTLSRVNRYR
jgi:hypothetical protein